MNDYEKAIEKRSNKLVEVIWRCSGMHNHEPYRCPDLEPAMQSLLALNAAVARAEVLYGASMDARREERDRLAAEALKETT